MTVAFVPQTLVGLEFCRASLSGKVETCSIIAEAYGPPQPSLHLLKGLTDRFMGCPVQKLDGLLHFVKVCNTRTNDVLI